MGGLTGTINFKRRLVNSLATNALGSEYLASNYTSRMQDQPPPGAYVCEPPPVEVRFYQMR